MYLNLGEKEVELVLKKYGFEGISHLMYLNNIMNHYNTRVIPLRFVEDEHNAFDIDEMKSFLLFLNNKKIYTISSGFIYSRPQNIMLRFNEKPRHGEMTAMCYARYDAALSEVPSGAEIEGMLAAYVDECREVCRYVPRNGMPDGKNHLTSAARMQMMQCLWLMLEHCRGHVGSLFLLYTFSALTGTRLKRCMEYAADWHGFRIDAANGVIYDSNLRLRDNMKADPDAEELMTIHQDIENNNDLFNKNSR